MATGDELFDFVRDALSRGVPRVHYRVIDTERYEVWASFATDAPQGAFADFWSHWAGMQCFILKVKETTPR